MKIVNYIPLILATLMYGAATYLILDMYLSIADGIGAEESVSLPISANIVSYLYLSGSVLVIGFFISEAMRKK